jgi:hypothetical protein
VGPRAGLDVMARMRDTRSIYSILVGKPNGKRQLGRPKRRWEYNIATDFSEI